MKSVIGKADCVIKTLNHRKQGLLKEINARQVQLEHRTKFIMHFKRGAIVEDLLGNVQSFGLYPV